MPVRWSRALLLTLARYLARDEVSKRIVGPSRPVGTVCGKVR